MKSEIYPIYLPDYMAENLISKYAQTEFDENARYQSRNTKYECGAKVLKDGDVVLHVHYSFDDGFCMGSGRLFEKTIRPYDDDKLKDIKHKRLIDLATIEYEKQQEAKRKAEIIDLARRMFEDEL